MIAEGAPAKPEPGLGMIVQVALHGLLPRADRTMVIGSAICPGPRCIACERYRDGVIFVIMRVSALVARVLRDLRRVGSGHLGDPHDRHPVER